MEVKTLNKLSPRAAEDYDYVLAAIEGNQKAYATLLERYRHSVFHTIYKMVNNRDDADDLTMEAFGKAFKKLPSYAPHYAFSTWLFKIAINNCIDHIRKKRLQTLSLNQAIEVGADRDFATNIPDSSRNPETAMIHEQKIQMVSHLVNQLGKKYRLMIELRYYQEMSYEEIAQELKIPLGTVKAQLFRAKEILYQHLLQPSTQAYADFRRVKLEM